MIFEIAQLIGIMWTQCHYHFSENNPKSLMIFEIVQWIWIIWTHTVIIISQKLILSSHFRSNWKFANVMQIFNIKALKGRMLFGIAEYFGNTWTHSVIIFFLKQKVKPYIYVCFITQWIFTSCQTRVLSNHLWDCWR